MNYDLQLASLLSSVINDRIASYIVVPTVPIININIGTRTEMLARGLHVHNNMLDKVHSSDH